jgi:hypothetical protein
VTNPAILLAVVDSEPPHIPGAVWILVDPMRLPNLTNVRWAHAWAIRARAVRAQHKAVQKHLDRHTPPPGPWLVRIHYVHWGTLDSDGLVTCAKGVRDCIAKWLGVNDGSKQLRWELSQQAIREREEYEDHRGRKHIRTVSFVGIEIATDPLWHGNPSAEGA